MSGKHEAIQKSHSLTPLPAASSSSSSAASSSSSSSKPAQPAPAATAVTVAESSDAPEAAVAADVHPTNYVSLKNWLIATGVCAAAVVLLLMASAGASVPGWFVWLMLFVSIWGAITVCCCTFSAAERCGAYLREQEMEALALQETGGETSGTMAAAASEQPYEALK